MDRAQLIAALWVALTLLVVGPAQAQDVYPALHDVTGVAAGDVLNIRTGPSASAPIIGALAPGQADVEVIAVNETGRWGRVNAGEAAGWAAMTYLARQPGQDGDALPLPLACFGTEPFWSAEIAGGAVSLATPEETLGFDLIYSQRASGRIDRYSFIATELLRDLHGVVRRTDCGDGMSDRAFGFDVDLIVLMGDRPAHLSGCCSVAGR